MSCKVRTSAVTGQSSGQVMKRKFCRFVAPSSEAFQNFNGGYSSAIAVALFVIILVFSLVQVRLLRTGGGR